MITSEQREEIRCMLETLEKNSTVHSKVIHSFDRENIAVEWNTISPECVIMPFVQRTRILLTPYIKDKIRQTRQQWIDMLKYKAGCFLSDIPVEGYLKFVVADNPPVKYLHLYISNEEPSKLYNYIYIT